MHDEPKKSAEGFYIVKHEVNFVYWLAWKTWLRDELGSTFFPAVMNGTSPFPPETWERAAAYAEYINMIRTKIKWGKRAPDAPKPWKRWTRDEMNSLETAEMARREHEGGWHAPSVTDGVMEPREGFYRAPDTDHKRAAYEREQIDSWQKNLVIEARRSRPKPSTKRELASLKSAERPPVPYIESPPELVAERMATLEAKLAEATKPRVEAEDFASDITSKELS